MSNIVWVLLVALLSYGLVKFVFRNEQVPTNEKDSNYAPIVQLNSGKVRGRVIEGADGNKLHFYEGIRFGQADRFEKAKPVEPWTDVYDATTMRTACPQPVWPSPMAQMFQNENQSEDCLFLNVWKPTRESNKKRSVMFYVHGGGYAIGTIFCIFTDAQYIADQGDVIVVAVNYRLGPFGFLHGGDVQGNMGLLDQILGLEWVRDNIEQFGGDPNEVTIFGASAGSMAVGSLVLTPLTKGLFKRAILQGGAPNSFMGGISKKTSLELTQLTASKLNCPTDDIQKSVDCLRHKSVAELLSVTAVDFSKPNGFFVPIHGDEVFPISPVEALKTGKFKRNIDIIFGVTENEGSMFVTGIFPKLTLSPANLTIESAKQDIEYMMNDIFRQGNGREVAKFYTDSLVNPTEDDLKIAISNVFGDLYLICPTIVFGEQMARHEPNNRYYAFRTMQAMLGDPDHQPWMGVQHGQDSGYIFLIPMLGTEQDKQLGRDLIRAFTSFAKTGVPGKMGNVQWEEAFDRKGEPNTRYLSLNHSNKCGPSIEGLDSFGPL